VSKLKPDQARTGLLRYRVRRRLSVGLPGPLADSNSKRGAGTGVLLLSLALLIPSVSACGGDSTRSATPTVTVTAPTDSMTGPSSPAVTQSSPSSSNTSTPGITTASASATPGQTVPSARANQPLGLADAQAKVGEWEESRYEIADRSDVRGMGVPVTYCGDNSGVSNAMLEYRLANRFKTLSMSISQANSSKQSDQQLTVAVIANGSQLDIQTVPFNQVKPVQVPVLGVNALQIRLSLNEKVKDCGYGGGVTGVIEQLVVS